MPFLTTILLHLYLLLLFHFPHPTTSLLSYSSLPSCAQSCALEQASSVQCYLPTNTLCFCNSLELGASAYVCSLTACASESKQTKYDVYRWFENACTNPMTTTDLESKPVPASWFASAAPTSSSSVPTSSSSVSTSSSSHSTSTASASASPSSSSARPTGSSSNPVSSSSPSSSNASSSKSSNSGLIAGIVAGVCVVILGMIIGGVFYYRKRKEREPTGSISKLDSNTSVPAYPLPTQQWTRVEIDSVEVKHAYVPPPSHNNGDVAHKYSQQQQQVLHELPGSV